MPLRRFRATLYRGRHPDDPARTPASAAQTERHVHEHDRERRSASQDWREGHQGAGDLPPLDRHRPLPVLCHVVRDGRRHDVRALPIPRGWRADRQGTTDRRPQVTVSPADALAVSGVTSPARVRLLETNGQASYVINPGKGSQVMVSASTGKVVRGVDADAARAIAGAFAKLPVASVSAPMDYDQWMGPPPIRPLSPVLQGLPRRSRRNRPLRVAEVG